MATGSPKIRPPKKLKHQISQNGPPQNSKMATKTQATLMARRIKTWANASAMQLRSSGRHSAARQTLNGGAGLTDGHGLEAKKANGQRAAGPR